MNVGDLVTLSSYGLKRHYNWPLVAASKNVVGLIVAVGRFTRSYPYTVRWSVSADNPQLTNSYSRRELKYATG